MNTVKNTFVIALDKGNQVQIGKVASYSRKYNLMVKESSGLTIVN